MNEKITKAVDDAINEVFEPHNSIKLKEIVDQPDFEFKALSESSIKYVEFCMRVEEALDIEIEFLDLMKQATYLGFINWLAGQADQK
ncbi:MAG TPA: hypothetical protein EYG79_03880 [Rhodobacteraceae bacterium]|nr:hypothetical protein [Paracoccaceae bacterium]